MNILSFKQFIKEVNVELLHKARENRRMINASGKKSKAAVKYQDTYNIGGSPTSLRTAKDNIDAFTKDTKKRIKDTDKGIQKEMGKNKTTVPMNVYRGISPKHVSGGKQHDRHYASTSFDPETARHFGGPNGHVQKIRVPAGTNYLKIPPNKDYNEKEVLLPSGTTTHKKTTSINASRQLGPIKVKKKVIPYHHVDFKQDQ